QGAARLRAADYRRPVAPLAFPGFVHTGSASTPALELKREYAPALQPLLLRQFPELVQPRDKGFCEGLQLAVRLGIPPCPQCLPRHSCHRWLRSLVKPFLD